jgi:hypothetical protein
MGLRDMYAYAIQTCKGKFHGNAEERDGKLYFKGTVATEAEKNEIWTAIKTIPTWQNDIVADIQVTGGPADAPAAKTYTVKAGTPRQRRRVYEDLRAEQGSADRPRQDQARTGAAPAIAPSTTSPRAMPARGDVAVLQLQLA